MLPYNIYAQGRESKIREGLFYKSLTLGSVMTLKKVVPLLPNGETLEQKLL
jgi:hypothetical protein